MSKNLILVMGILLIWFLVIRNRKTESQGTANTPKASGVKSELKKDKTGTMTLEYVGTQGYTL